MKEDKRNLYNFLYVCILSLLINVVLIHPSQYTLAPPNIKSVPTPLQIYNIYKGIVISTSHLLPEFQVREHNIMYMVCEQSH